MKGGPDGVSSCSASQPKQCRDVPVHRSPELVLPVHAGGHRQVGLLGTLLDARVIGHRKLRFLEVLVLRPAGAGGLIGYFEYSASISAAYFSAIGLRLSFIVGVSSSPPGCQSVGQRS